MTEMIIIGLLAFCLITSLYVVINLYRKVDFLEQVLEGTVHTIQTVLQNLQEIDTLGSFEADDETGSMFTDLKTEIETLNKIVEERNA